MMMMISRVIWVVWKLAKSSKNHPPIIIIISITLEDLWTQGVPRSSGCWVPLESSCPLPLTLSAFTLPVSDDVLCICVFVYLCICVFAYLCICVFVFVHLSPFGRYPWHFQLSPFQSGDVDENSYEILLLESPCSSICLSLNWSYLLPHLTQMRHAIAHPSKCVSVSENHPSNTLACHIMGGLGHTAWAPKEWRTK